MILRRFYDEPLAQASYLVGCAKTGEALIVDPNRAIGQYIDAAAREGLRITHVTETHIHADFLSGLRELASVTGAQAFLSAEGGADWQYYFANDSRAVLLRDNDVFMVGNIRIQAMHTPGHTPEHITFLVTDTAGADQPMGAFTGDFIFAGDVGRPDLLEKAAGVSGTMEAGARDLFASIQRFKKNADYLQLWPGHGAGSACGKALGAVPQTTLGYEKLFNWALAETDETAFVAAVLEGQPDPPKYFKQMKRMNRAGPRLLGTSERTAQLAPERLQEIIESGATVVDTRGWKDFARNHARGTVNIPLSKSFPTWAGWLIAYDAPFYLIADNGGDAARAVHSLHMIGLDNIAGVFHADALAAGGELSHSTEITAGDMRAASSDAGVTILDVRNDDEWESGHVPTANGAQVLHIPLGHLQDRIAEVPTDSRVIVHCKAGGRSAIATSILETHGVAAENVKGGFDAWRVAGAPVESETGIRAGKQHDEE